MNYVIAFDICLILQLNIYTTGFMLIWFYKFTNEIKDSLCVKVQHVHRKGLFSILTAFLGCYDTPQSHTFCPHHYHTAFLYTAFHWYYKLCAVPQWRMIYRQRGNNFFKCLFLNSLYFITVLFKIKVSWISGLEISILVEILILINDRVLMCLINN